MSNSNEMGEQAQVEIREEIQISESVSSNGGDNPESSGVTGEQKWNQAIRWIIYALAFLLPILFTPWTFEPLEFSKQVLLFALTTGALGIWLLKLLVFRSWQFVKTPLDLPVLVYVVVYLLASVFSVDRIASFLGFYGSFSGNFFQILFLVLFFYLVINNFHTIKEIKKLLSVFFLSVFIGLLYTLTQFTGFHILPFEIAKVNSFNTIGGLVAVSVFSAFAVVMSFVYTGEKWFGFHGRAWRVITAIAGFVILLTINFSYAWIGLLIGLLVYMAFRLAFSGKQAGIKEVITPLVLIIVVASVLIMQLIFDWSARDIVNFNLPSEVRLDYKTATPVLEGVVKNKPVFGSGPNTFIYAFSEYRDQNYNLSPFWNIRFDKGPSEAAELLVGTGIIGFLAFEILMLIFLVYAFFYVSRKKEYDSWEVSVGLFASFLVLWFSHWFFFFNTVMAFSLWMVMASFLGIARIAGGERTKIYKFSLADSPRQAVSLVTGVSFALVLVVIFIFFTASVYAADIFYRQGLQNSNQVETYDSAQANFARAVELNPFRPDYFLTYGEFLFLRINQELAKEDPNLGQVQQWLADGINTSKVAVDLSPNNWTAWERLANLYTSARPLVAGVEPFIVEYLERATENDPKNPILFVELGQVHRLAAQQIDLKILGEGVDTDSDGLSDAQETTFGSDPENPDTNGNTVLDGNEVMAGLNPAGAGQLSQDILSKYVKVNQEALIKAEEAFRKAIELKEDYATAYYQLAATLEQSGQNDKAIEELKKSLEKFPNNVTLKFELARLLFNTDQIDESAAQFQQILRIVPNHANARYSLAIAFERLGKPKQALRELRIIAEENSDNEILKQKIQQLESQVKELEKATKTESGNQ